MSREEPKSRTTNKSNVIHPTINTTNITATHTTTTTTVTATATILTTTTTASTNSYTTCSSATINSAATTTAFLTASSCDGIGGKISTSTPHKRSVGGGSNSNADGRCDEAAGAAHAISLRDMVSAAFLPDDSIATTISPPGSRNLSVVSAASSFSKSSTTNNSAGSSAAKRHLSAASVTRARPQSSYSARALVFDDSDQELGASGGSGSGSGSAGGSPRVSSNQPELSVGATKSSVGLDMLSTSSKMSGGEHNISTTSLTTSHSLLRNSNLTKSSSGGLSGSSASLTGRSYNALLRKISYQHGYSMRSSSNGEYRYKLIRRLCICISIVR